MNNTNPTMTITRDQFHQLLQLNDRLAAELVRFIERADNDRPFLQTVLGDVQDENDPPA